MSYHHLTLAERKKIAHLEREGAGKYEIARQLGRSPSTIYRELERNKTLRKNGRRDKYSYRNAHKMYLGRLHRATSGKYQIEDLCDYVREKLRHTWSPEQIAGRLPLDYPHTGHMRISHGTIYRWLHRGLLAQAAQLKLNLRHHGHTHGEKRGKFNGVRELKERSRLALKRRRLGDWEVDTIVSCAPGHSDCLLSVCDRKSRYCGLVLLKRKTNLEVMRGFQFLYGSGELPMKTITADRGTEFSCFSQFEETFHIPFYFARPRSPWQKPSVENQNGLVRQFFPKGTDFHQISEQQVAQVMQILNNRPRKCLGFRTPSEVLHLV